MNEYRRSYCEMYNQCIINDPQEAVEILPRRECREFFGRNKGE